MDPIGAASDASLVERARLGDPAAFSELFRRHRGAVAKVCSQRLTFSTDVDDAVQESFARALGRLHQLRDPARFGAWVRSIAVRACTDHHREGRRVIVLDDVGASEIADTRPLPDEALELREQSAVLRAHLFELGERDRRALWMRHVADAPVAAVATELGLTEGSTRVLLTRARHRLRAAVAGLPVLVPLSWRQWWRDHLPAATPAMEMLAVAVAVTVTAGGIVAAPAPPKSHAEAAPAVVRDQREHAPRREAQQGAPSTRQLRVVRVPVFTAAADRAATAAAAPAATDAARAPLRDRVDGVKVRRSYPDESTSQEIVDVTIFANDDQTSVGLYADDVNDAIESMRGAEGGEQSEDLLVAP